MNDHTNLYSFHNASNQLEFFIKTKAANYSKMRNFDLGSLEKNFVSGLSPAITRRIISEDYVNGYLFELAFPTVANAKIMGLWENAPTQATDLTDVKWAD